MKKNVSNRQTHPTRISRQRRPETRGTALLEVLMAVSMIAISMGVSTNAIGLSARTQSGIGKALQAQRLIEEQVATLRAQGRLSGTGDVSGRFEAPFADIRWVATTRPSSHDSLKWVDVQVYRQGNKDKSDRARVLVYGR